jgi:hypothetical protein
MFNRLPRFTLACSYESMFVMNTQRNFQTIITLYYYSKMLNKHNTLLNYFRTKKYINLYIANSRVGLDRGIGKRTCITCFHTNNLTFSRILKSTRRQCDSLVLMTFPWHCTDLNAHTVVLQEWSALTILENILCFKTIILISSSGKFSNHYKIMLLLKNAK